MTKEHIISNFLYSEFPTQKLGYNQRADRFMKWEVVVRDVCQRCNGGPLSALDSYAREFLKDVHCERTYPEPIHIKFRYDYDLLARWLFKVSYNAARGVSRVSPLLKATVPYILTGRKRPELAFLSVEVLRDTPLDEDHRKYLPPGAGDWHHVPTRMFRVGLGGPDTSSLQGSGAARVLLSVCGSECVVLHRMLGSDGLDWPTRRRIVRLYHRSVPDAVLLSRDKEDAAIWVSRKTGLEAYAMQGARVARQWQDYMENVALSNPALHPSAAGPDA